MGNKTYNVGIVGCGKIFPRHIEAINQNDNFNLIAVCDIDKEKTSQVLVNRYTDYRSMFDNEEINFAVIATPNGQHFEQAKYFLERQCDVLLEKPATLQPTQIDLLLKIAENNSAKAYAVLQVRLNSCIQNLKKLIDSNAIGDIRGISLVQRWQRPKEYFSDWRGDPLVGGGLLHECGIHYLDVLCYLFGKPTVVSSKKYNTKHLGVDIEDTVYSLLDYGSYGGNVEINISSEPRNLECSLSIMTSRGFIKLGGKAMNFVEKVSFITEDESIKISDHLLSNNIVGSPNSYGSYSGSCPNHPNLYKKINLFTLQESKNVLYLIDEIYKHCNTRYY
jgi:UDP-N-acetyl-2-amino-2-deoxyglucuronate dehydrogenase